MGFKGKIQLMMKLQRAVFHSWTGTLQAGIHSNQTGRFKSIKCHHLLRNNASNLSLVSTRTISYPSKHSHQITCSSYTAPLSHLHFGDKHNCILLQQSRMKSTYQITSSASNPLLTLQQYVPLPILTDNELIFTPTEADIAQACQLFIPTPRHKIIFNRGAYYNEQAPSYKLPEIAFIGRSNVGKSSLIKAIFSNVPEITIRTSRTPGHTKLLLFFQVGSAFSLVDMPGYGYNQPKNFIISAEGFLKARKNLRNTFLLIDSSVGLQSLDFVAIDMLEEFSIPYLVVFTKSDKASKRQLVESIMTVKDVIREKTQCCLPQPFLVSTKSGAGLSFLKGFIAYTTGNLQLEELS